MIDLKFTGMCENCEHSDLYLEKTELCSSDLSGGKLISHNIHCRHEDLCKSWRSHLVGLEYDTLVVHMDDIDAVNRVIIESGQLCRIFHEDGKRQEE